MGKAIIALVLLATALGAGAWVIGNSRGVDGSGLEARYLTAADRFVTVDGARVRVREEGPEDAPVVVLLHGFTFSLESWDGWARELRDEFRIVRFDLLGHGLTGPDSQRRYAPEERAEFLGDLLDALGHERVHLAGNSLGGLVAWRFAADHPARVDRLILKDAAAFPMNGVADEPAPVPPMMEAFLRFAPEAGVRQSLAFVYADAAAVTETRVAVLVDLMRRAGNGQAFVDHLNEFTLPDPRSDLARITAPTLILWGGQDALIGSNNASLLAAAIRDAQTIIYDDLGHVPQEEDAARTVRDARDFLLEGSDELGAGLRR